MTQADRSNRLEAMLARCIEVLERGDTPPSPDTLCADDPALREALNRALADYRSLEDSLGFRHSSSGQTGIEKSGSRRHDRWQSRASESVNGNASEPQLPQFTGFRTVERLGAGGMGEVYKLHDLRLERMVAAKVLKRSPVADAYGDFLREARALALFRDPRIVQIHELRTEGESPVLLMELIEGFTLDRIGPSLTFDQRAHLVREICTAIHRAHEMGIQHRDLKPGNLMVTGALEPKIVDFGLALGDSRRGHGVGTFDYLAPEQLDPTRDIDHRSDIYSLGVVLYELLCGERPYPVPARGKPAPVATEEAVRQLRPRLPIEIASDVPEPLQAIALKAMDPDPEHRYATARAMALDLGRFLDHRPVLARPTLYATALTRRLRPHLDDIREWLTLRLVHPHEAQRLRTAYRRLQARDEDWIVESRRLSPAQVALYLGAFLTLAGSLFTFAALRLFEGSSGWADPAWLEPLLVLTLPAAGLFATGRWLEERPQQAVTVAFYLTATLLLPVALLVLLPELGWWPESDRALLLDTGVSNRHLQLAMGIGASVAFVLARRTRTVALSTTFTVLVAATAIAVLSDLGLRTWLENGRYDRCALALVPLLLFNAGVGRGMAYLQRGWLAKPLFVAAAISIVVILELLALDGRALGHLGIDLRSWQPADVDDPSLLATLLTMTFNGLIIYSVGAHLDRRGSELAGPAAHLLVTITPFAMLAPLGYLSFEASYSRAFLWLYLALALSVAWVSHFRQRKSFFAAGVLSAGIALVRIADRYEWLDVPAWATALLIAGLVTLLAGAGLDWHARTRLPRS